MNKAKLQSFIKNITFLILRQHNCTHILVIIEKFNRLIMLRKEWDKTAYLLKAKVSFGRTSLHRKLTLTCDFSTL